MRPDQDDCNSTDPWRTLPFDPGSTRKRLRKSGFVRHKLIIMNLQKPSKDDTFDDHVLDISEK